MVKSSFSRTIAMMLSIIIMLSGFGVLTSTQTNAASNEVTLNSIDTGIKWAKTISFYEPYSKKTLTYWQGQSRFIMRISQNNAVAYCLQPAAFIYDQAKNERPKLSTSYQGAWKRLSDDQRKAIELTLYYGYPNNNLNLSGNNYQKEIATQLIVWELVCGYRDPNSYNLTDYRFIKGMCGNDYKTNVGVYSSYSQIQSAMKSHNTIISFTSKSTNTAPTYTLYWDGTKYTTTLTDKNNVLSKYTLSSTDKNVTLSKSGNNLTVSSSQPISSAINIKATTTIGDSNNNIVSYGHYNPEIQEIIDESTAGLPDPVKSYLKIKTQPTGSFKVEKEYEDISGVNIKSIENFVTNNTKFKVKNSAGKYIIATYPNSGTTYSYKTITDNEDNATTFTPKKSNGSYFFKVDKLPAGTYTIMEQDNGYSGFYAESSRNISVSVTANNSGGEKTATFKNRPTQLVIKKDFVQFGSTSDEDYKKVSFKLNIKYDGGTTNANFICVDSDKNIYQYVRNTEDPAFSEKNIVNDLSFVNPGVHQITVIGLPVHNKNGFYYEYTAVENSTGLINSRYTYNTFTRTFKTTTYQSGTVTNKEKNIGRIEIKKDFVIENTDGTHSAFNGNDNLSLTDAYKDISFVVKNESGKYIIATGNSDNYTYSGTTDNSGNATKFVITNTSTKKLSINSMPFGKYTVTEIVGSKVKGQGFNIDGSANKTTVTSYNINSMSANVGSVKFVNVKPQYVGLRIYKTFVNKDDEDINISRSIISRVNFFISDEDGNRVSLVCDDASKGKYHVYKNEGSPTTTISIGLQSNYATVTGLNAGKKYTVHEVISSASLKDFCVCRASFTVEGTKQNPIVYAPDDSTAQETTVILPDTERSTAEVHFINTFKTTEIEIQKKSDDDLVERKFRITTTNTDLYTEENPLIVKSKLIKATDGSVTGVVKVKDLPIAEYDTESNTIRKIEYKIEETEIPEYYNIPDAQVIIPADGQKNVVFKNTLKSGGIKVIKKAEVNGSTKIIPLAGVEFRLTNNYNKTVLTETTDKNGKLQFNNLPIAVGTLDKDGNETVRKIRYTISEVAGDKNKNYVLADDRTITLDYEETKKIKSLEIINKPITGNIYLEKADLINNELLSGAEFTLYNDVNGNGKYDESTDTVANGYVLSTDDEGKTTYIPSSIMIENTTLTTDDDGNETTVGTGRYELNNIPKGKYVIVETASPVGYVKEKKEFAFEITTDEETLHIYEKDGKPIVDHSTDDNHFVHNTPVIGSVSLEKIDAESKKMLSGAKFRVWKDTDNNGKLNPNTDETMGLMTEITDADGNSTGKFVMDNLRYGNYFVVERIAPEGYLRSTQVYSFSITKDGEKVFVGKISNTPIFGNICITKIDALSKEKLKGAEFTVYQDIDKDGIITDGIDTVYSKMNDNGDGTYYLNDIPYGEYILKETKSPDGYVITNKVYPFQIQDNGATIVLADDGEIGIPNTPIHGSIRIIKVDNNTHTPLEGAEFTLYNDKNEIIKTAVTNSDGIADFADIRYGKYTVKETTAPKHYVLDETPIPFEILEDGKLYEYTQENKPDTGSLEIIKTSEDGIVNGVMLNVKGTSDNNTKIDQTVVTDENGKAEIKDLLTGTYTVTELKVADRYIETVPQTVVVEKDKTATVTFENKLKRGNVITTKFDADYPENKLSGAVFEVYDSDHNFAGTMNEVDTGVYELDNIPYGDYTIKETKAPEGFCIDDKEYSFQIRENGKTVSVSNNAGDGYLNNAQKGSLIIQKRSSDGKLEGFSFTVTGKSVTGQEYKETFITDKYGKISIQGLRIGTYTISEISDKTNEKYILPQDKTVEIKPDETVNVEMFNEETGIEITKLDVSNGKPIPNVSFRIRNADGKIIREGKTDEDGIVKFSKLPYGKYTYQEINAPEGYIIDETEYPFEVKIGGGIVKAVMTNQPVPKTPGYITTPTTPDQPTPNVNTGDNQEMMTIIFAGLCLLSLGVLAVFLRKKSND